MLKLKFWHLKILKREHLGMLCIQSSFTFAYSASPRHKIWPFIKGISIKKELFTKLIFYTCTVKSYWMFQYVILFTIFSMSNICCLQIDAQQPPNISPNPPRPILLTNVLSCCSDKLNQQCIGMAFSWFSPTVFFIVKLTQYIGCHKMPFPDFHFPDFFRPIKFHCFDSWDFDLQICAIILSPIGQGHCDIWKKHHGYTWGLVVSFWSYTS